MPGSQQATRRVALLVDGQIFDLWTSVRISRSLEEISGSFQLEYVDQARVSSALTTLTPPPPVFKALETGQKCELRIDGETVLVGWIGHVSGRQTARAMSTSISGRDICGDLVECAASPQGPAEWKNITLDAFARQILAPFKIGLSVQTDVGAPFPTLCISPHEKALPALEKAARQRSTLVTSDGIANLVLTTGGSTSAPDAIEVGRNVVACDFEDNADHRFSDVFVKGQTAHGRGYYVGPCARDATAAPGGDFPGEDATSAEAAAIIMTGHAQDPEITRWRPDVRMVNTQSGASTVQEQAEWHIRIDRGQSVRRSYTVLDFRAGESRALWRPNQLVAVYDPFAEIDDDLLIAGVDYIFNADGAQTTLKLVGRTAFDRINEPARRRPRHRRRLYGVP